MLAAWSTTSTGPGSAPVLTSPKQHIVMCKFTYRSGTTKLLSKSEGKLVVLVIIRSSIGIFIIRDMHIITSPLNIQMILIPCFLLTIP